MKQCLDCPEVVSSRKKRCEPCRRRWDREYKRLWARNHPEQGRASRARYAAANPEKFIESRKQRLKRWYEKKGHKRARVRNRALDRRSGRDWYARKSQDPAFAEAARQRATAWYRANTARAIANAHRRRARLRDSCSPGVTAPEWAAICEEYTVDGVVYCAYCEKPAAEVEHVLAIANGGRDAPDNVVPACKACNRSKQDKVLLWQWVGKGIRSVYLEVGT